MILRHTFDKTILREYDIRGIVGDNLNNKDAKMLGYFFGSIVKINTDTKPTIVVSRDGRLSSEILSSNLLNGLKKAGANIIDIGLNPTPVLYFANKYFSADAAIQVTGSHNPKNYNGFKIIANNKSFFGKDIQSLNDFAKKGSDKVFNGKITKKHIKSEYIKRILEPLQGDKNDILNKKFIIWDCCNGATGEIIEKLTKSIPGKHKVLFSEIDGNFPNHPPDPTKLENLRVLKKTILNSNADYGIAFDGDGDRITIMTNQGNLISGDILTAFLAKSITDKSNEIILDVKSGLAAINSIEKDNFKVDIFRTGHSHIKSILF